MVCQKCGSQINDGESFCPVCGEPVGTGAAGVEQNQAGMPDAAQAGGFRKFVTGHKWQLMAGAAVILVLLLVVVFLNWEVLNNWIRRTFSSPEDYYHYVEKKSVEAFSADAGELYGRYYLDNLDISDRSVSARVDITLGEGGRELVNLAGLAGVDLSWLESLSYTMVSSMKREALAMELGVVLNGVDIVTGNMVYDLEDKAVYVQVPKINERYLGVAVPDSGYDDVDEIWETYEMLAAVCPDQKELEELLGRYLMTVVTCMDDVSRQKGILSVEDIEQKCTVLTVTADANTFRNAAIEILRLMQTDEDIERIIKEAAANEDFMEELELEDRSPEEAYEQFRKRTAEKIEELVSSGELAVSDDETFRMKVYVDRKGKIVGRVMETDNVTLSRLMPEKGKQFGYELSYADFYYEDPDYDESWYLTGTGMRDDDRIDGEFVLAYCDMPFLNIRLQDLHAAEMKKGMLSGHMILGLTEDVEEQMEYSPGLSIIQGMELAMDFVTEEDAGKCDMRLSMRDRDFVDVSVSYERHEAYQGADPGTNVVIVTGEEELIEWSKYLHMTELSDSLRQAGVPSEFTDALDVFDKMDKETLIRMMYYYY